MRQGRHKTMDKGLIVKEIMLLTQEALNMAELTSCSEYQYKKYRQKFLRLSNNVLRKLEEQESENRKK
jgi:hypothetical protein